MPSAQRRSRPAGRLGALASALAAIALCPSAIADAAAPAAARVSPQAITLFLLFVIASLFISYLAAKRTKSSAFFYTAGGQITGLQNGMAIAGDFMSAASFLGITGLMFIGGFDGLIFALGAFAGFPILLFLFAERLRNLGQHTFTDIAALRLDETQLRIVLSLTTVTIVILYLIAQAVGAGKLVELLFGLPYELAVSCVGVLVIAYVASGGMLATTWVQIIKAILLLTGATLMTVLTLGHFGFDITAMFETAAERHRLGADIFRPGQLIPDPIQVLTTLVAMTLGTLGLPHILMRFFTVPDMRAARSSAVWATMFMGYFYFLLIVIGFGAIALLAGNPDFVDSTGRLVGGNNMTAVHLAKAVGGDWLMGFMSAVAFATILAVVAGLTVAGSAAISHDLYARVICRGAPDPRRELQITRVSTVTLGLMAVGLGILFQHQNIAFIATLPFVFAASVNFPILALSLYWDRLTTRGAVTGAVTGLAMSLLFTVLGPKVWVDVLGFEQPWFPYDYPALFTVPVVLALIVAVSLLDRSPRARIDRDNYQRLIERAEFGERPPGSERAASGAH